MPSRTPVSTASPTYDPPSQEAAKHYARGSHEKAGHHAHVAHGHHLHATHHAEEAPKYHVEEYGSKSYLAVEAVIGIRDGGEPIFSPHL